MRVEDADPLASHEVITKIQDLPVPRSGAFAMEAYSCGALLGTVRFAVTEGPTTLDEHCDQLYD